MKVIIAGSRNIWDKDRVVKAIYQSKFDIDEVVCGLAPGVDTLGKEWAQYHADAVKEFPADWNTHGKKAGILRNIDMGNYADALIAVWDGKSKGTQHMIQYMQKLGKPVYVDSV